MKYLILLALLGCTEGEPNSSSKQISCSMLNSKIKFIGICNKDADCGVVLEDGKHIMYSRFPFVGQLPSGPYCKTIE